MTYLLKDWVGKLWVPGTEKPKGQLVVDGGVRQAAVFKVVGVVEHIVGDHVAHFALGAVGVDPVGDGPDLTDAFRS